jgi:hypothetical protein
LLRVQDEQGRILVFRFYDPRVLRVYMPTCEPSETMQMLGPVHALMCEKETGKSLVVFAENGAHANEKLIPSASIFQMKSNQLSGLRGYYFSRFCSRLTEFLGELHFDLIDGDASIQLNDFVVRAVRKGHELGFFADATLAEYVSLCIQLGPEFHDHPHVQVVFSDPFVKSENRIRSLLERLSPVQWGEVRGARNA